MRSSIFALVAEGEAAGAELPMHPVMYGVIAFAILMFLLFLTMAYRNVRTRRR